MGWFSDDKDEKLKQRDWSSERASEANDRPGHAYGSVETHERIDGTYIVEKDGLGNVVNVRKK